MSRTQAASNELQHFTLHDELCCSDLDAIANCILYGFALPQHDVSLLSQERVEGMRSCIKADLDDMIAAVPVGVCQASGSLIPWDAQKASALPLERALSSYVDVPESLEEDERHEKLAGYVWDLMADAFPVWSE